MVWRIRRVREHGRIAWEVGYHHPTGWCAEGNYPTAEEAAARARRLNDRGRRPEPWRIYELLTRGAADN
jgi:hypothetical protein